MYYTSPQYRNQREGIVLLLVITFLALFAAVALAFVYYAEAEASNSGLASLANNKTFPDVDPELLLSYYLRQLIYDADDNPYSAMRGHGLSRAMWGAASGGAYSGIGRLHYNNNAAPGVNGDDYYYPNYTYFQTDGGIVRDPEYYGTRAVPATWTPLNPSTGLYRPGNAPYTYPDMNNMYLARVDIDSTTGMPVVITPSFHRSYLDATSRHGVLYPTNQDYHTNFNPPDADLGGHVRNLDFSLGYKYIDPKTGKITYYNNDSYWMDLGFPYMIAPNGKKYKPLFAALVTDLDNRMNMLVAGNARGTSIYQDPKSGAVTTFASHVSNRGYGPTEMNLNYLWFLQGLSPKVPTAAPNGYVSSPNGVGVPLLASDLASPFTTPTQGLIPIRGSGGPLSTWPLRDGPNYGRLDFDGLNSGRLQLPGEYGAAPNAFFTTPNYPAYPNPPATSPPYIQYPWYAANAPAGGIAELAAHPLGTTYYAQLNAYNNAASLAAILRHRGTGSAAATSDWFQGMPNTFSNNFLRNQLTTMSWSLDRTAASPYRWWSPNGGFQYNALKRYPQLIYAQAPGSVPGSPNYGAYTPQIGSEFTATSNSTLGGQVRVNLNRLNVFNSVNNVFQYDYPTPDGNGYINVNPNIPGNQFSAFSLAQGARQKLAADIYSVFLQVTGALNPNTYTVVTAGGALTPATISVGSTQGFPSSGIININMGGGVLVQVAYTGTTPTAFTGCTGNGMGMLQPGQIVTNAAMGAPYTSPQFQAARWLAQLAVNIVDYVDNDDVATPFAWFGDPNLAVGSTTVAVTSNGQTLPNTLPAGTVYVGSTAGFPAQGTFYLNTGASWVPITYTGTAPANLQANPPIPFPSFTGCAGGAGAVLTTGQPIQAFLTPPEYVYGTELPRLVINEAYAQVDNNPTDPMGAAGNYNLDVWTELVNPLGVPTTVTSATAAGPLPQGTINVLSTGGFQPAGTIILNTGAGVAVISYTGVTQTSFTGCTGGTAANILAPGQLITQDTSVMDNGLARLNVGMPTPTLYIPPAPPPPVANTPTQPPTTLPGGPGTTIYVTNDATAGQAGYTDAATNALLQQFPQAGILKININGNWTTVNYTGIQLANTTLMPPQYAAFLNCTGGVGTLAQGQVVMPYTSAYKIEFDQQDAVGLRNPGNNKGQRNFLKNGTSINNGASIWDPNVTPIVVLPNNGQAQGPVATPYNNGFFVAGPPAAAVARSPSLPTSYTNAGSGCAQMAAPMTAAQLTAANNVITNGTTLLLRKLACPYIPPQLNPAAPSYNPYITIDYIQNVKTYDVRANVGGVAATPVPPPPTAGGYSAMGRLQPYGAGYLAPQPAVAGQPNNSFFQQNGPNTQPFNWLTHLDRPVVNQIELMHVSGFHPHELTQQFITYSFDVNGNLQQTPYTHYAPWTDHAALIYRALDLLGVPSYLNSPNYGNNPVASNRQSVTVDNAQMPISTGNAVPGKININTLNDVFLTDPATGASVPATFMALCDPQLASPNNVSGFNQSDVVAIYNAMIASRSPGNAANGIPVGYPGPLDTPFRGFSAGWIPSAAGDTQYPLGAGLRDTLLRSVTINGNTQRVFVPPSQVGQHPYRQMELLQKIFNNVTTTSNVFAVWLTVGFFEVQDYDPNTGQAVTPPKLLGELGYDQQHNIRHRFFAIVDRSLLAGYTGPPASYNARTDPVVQYFTVIK